MTNEPSDLDESHARPARLRFGLRTLFGGVSLICIALAVFVAVDPFLRTGMLLGGLVILAHVAAASIGNRMLQEATRKRG